MSIEKICKHHAVLISKSNTLKRAAELMRDRNVGSVIVVENEALDRHPIGIITDRDIALRAFIDNKSAESPVEEAMSKNLLTLSHKKNILDALKEMQEKSVRRAPVIDEMGDICGVVAIDDLVCLLIDELGDIANLIKHQLE